MAKSNYEFKKLKTKTMPSKIVESTAVRVLAKASQKLSSGWKKFISIPNAIVDRVKEEAINSKVDDMARISAKMEENQDLINTIRQDEQANSGDFDVMAAAQAENEKLEEKLGKIMNKKVKLETKKGESVDLNAILSQELGSDEVAKASTFDELNQAFDAAGIVAVNPAPVVEPAIQPVVEPTAVELAFVPTPAVETPVIETPKQMPTVENTNNIDPVVSQVISTFNDAKKAIEQNGVLNRENETLKQTNASQAVTIANLTKENETLKESVKDKNVLVQQITTYESVIAKHEAERAEMNQEVERLKFSTKENLAHLDKLASDMEKILKERDFYKNQILALKNAIGFNEPTMDQQTVGENRVR
jgi:predicted RNase H-like nuclease (RuvC/YqgF family)